MRKTKPEPGDRRMRGALFWLLPVVLGWGVLAALAHQTTQWAISWTGELFGWALLLTYVCTWGAVIALSRNARLMLIRAITVNLVVVTVILSLEIAAGLKLVHWQLLFEKMAGEGSEYITSYRLDPDLGFGRQPNKKWSGSPQSDIERGFSMPASLRKPITFTYDQWGYRNPPQLHDAEVVLIGDSYTEGAYVSDDQTIASGLETRLGKPVANLGIAGYGSLQELIVLKRDAPRYGPRVVIWFFFEGNDFYDDNKFEYSLPAETAKSGKIIDPSEDIVGTDGWRKRSFTSALIRRLRLLSEPLLPAQAPYYGHLSGSGNAGQKVFFADYASIPWSEWLMGRWNTTTSTFREAKAFAQQQNAEILFCLVPIKFRVYQPFVEYSRRSPMRSWTIWPLRDLFSQACESADLACLDLTPVLQKAVRNGGMPYAPTDTHWGSEGNELVSAVLAEELCRRRWLGRCSASKD